MTRTLTLIALVLTLAAPSMAEDTTVLMFVRDGARDLELMLDEETGVMKRMLEDAGIEVVVATTSGKSMRAGDLVLEADLAIAEAKASDYDGFILPCMAPAPGTPVPEAIVTLITEAFASGKPIAASRGSVAIVAEAGALQGRSYSYAREVDVAERPEFAGGTYEGTGYSQDGPITTVGICPLAARSLDLPDGTADLTRGFIESLQSDD